MDNMLEMIFQSTHPVGGGTVTVRLSRGDLEFQSTHPVGGGTCVEQVNTDGTWLFQSTHPVGGGTTLGSTALDGVGFQSTHPVGGGTVGGDLIKQHALISIHPPRGGWDLFTVSHPALTPYFNPPTPWGVGRAALMDFLSIVEFQSTHPVGGGTLQTQELDQFSSISIHPPRGGWDWCFRTYSF